MQESVHAGACASLEAAAAVNTTHQGPLHTCAQSALDFWPCLPASNTLDIRATHVPCPQSQIPYLIGHRRPGTPPPRAPSSPSASHKGAANQTQRTQLRPIVLGAPRRAPLPNSL